MLIIREWAQGWEIGPGVWVELCVFMADRECVESISPQRNNKSLGIVCCAQEALPLPIFGPLSTSPSISCFCPSEGVRAARRRARPAICWTSSLRSLTTSSTL